LHICYLTIDSHSAQKGGGIASYLSVMSQSLTEHGHQVTILAPGKAHTCQTSGTTGRLHLVEVPCANWHWYWFKLAFFARSTTLPLREIEWSRALWRGVSGLSARHGLSPIDVVEAAEIGNLSYQPQQHPPLVIRAHGNTWAIHKAEGRRMTFGVWLDRRLERIGMRRAAVFSAVSRFHADALRVEFPPPAPPITVIPNPVNLHMFNADTPPDAAPLIFYAGRIESNKGILTLFRAMQQIVKAIPTAQLIMAGRRHPSLSDHALSEALAPLQNSFDGPVVRLLGHLPWEETVAWYRRAPVFVMPSLYESFCLAVAEAMASGRPVVATTAGALPELVIDGVTGRLVAPGDADALAAALIATLNDRAGAQKMGEAGSRRVHELYTADRVVAQSEALYAAAAARQPITAFTT